MSIAIARRPSVIIVIVIHHIRTCHERKLGLLEHQAQFGVAWIREFKRLELGFVAYSVL